MISSFLLSLALGSCPACDGDLDTNEVIDGLDVAVMLSRFGTTNNAADINDDGIVDGADFAIQLSNWGNCSCMCVDWIDCTILEDDPSCGTFTDAVMRRCPDINDNREVDGTDLVILMQWWGYGPITDQSESCDLNDDGTVDGRDLVLLLWNYGRTY
tara:strand:+ start:396 stop:866 length:471 start_codon:yes stop_codon:yes gene_type:complete